MSLYSSYTLPANVTVLSALPRVGQLPQHLFPQLELIRFGSGRPWSGGDLAAHLDSIPAIVADQTQRQLGSVAWLLDIEHPRLPLDGSPAANHWVGATLDAIKACSHLPVSLYDSTMLADHQDFLSPCTYPSCEVVPIPGPSGQGSYAWYIKTTSQRLRQFASFKKPLKPYVATSYYWDPKPPMPVHMIQTMVVLAADYGDPVLWAAPQSQPEADQYARQLSAASAA